MDAAITNEESLQRENQVLRIKALVMEIQLMEITLMTIQERLPRARAELDQLKGETHAH